MRPTLAGELEARRSPACRRSEIRPPHLRAARCWMRGRARATRATLGLPALEIEVGIVATAGPALHRLADERGIGHHHVAQVVGRARARDRPFSSLAVGAAGDAGEQARQRVARSACRSRRPRILAGSSVFCGSTLRPSTVIGTECSMKAGRPLHDDVDEQRRPGTRPVSADGRRRRRRGSGARPRSAWRALTQFRGSGSLTASVILFPVLLHDAERDEVEDEREEEQHEAEREGRRASWRSRTPGRRPGWS